MTQTTMNTASIEITAWDAPEMTSLDESEELRGPLSRTADLMIKLMEVPKGETRSSGE
jgi:hypothetical protein